MQSQTTHLQKPSLNKGTKPLQKGGGPLPGPGSIHTATEMTFLGLN